MNFYSICALVTGVCQSVWRSGKAVAAGGSVFRRGLCRFLVVCVKAWHTATGDFVKFCEVDFSMWKAAKCRQKGGVSSAGRPQTAVRKTAFCKSEGRLSQHQRRPLIAETAKNGHFIGRFPCSVFCFADFFCHVFLLFIVYVYSFLLYLYAARRAAAYRFPGVSVYGFLTSRRPVVAILLQNNVISDIFL